MGQGWAGRGSSRAWRRKRIIVLRRDQHRCQLKLDGCTHRATTVHHLVPWVGDPAQVPTEHLLAACQPCNGKAGDPRGTDPEPRPFNL